MELKKLIKEIKSSQSAYLYVDIHQRALKDKLLEKNL